MTIKVVIPWPHKDLSPNVRAHWSVKARHKRVARWEAKLRTNAAKRGVVLPEKGSIYMRVTAHPPDKRKRDLDNVQASLKSALDGIADSLGIDDSCFHPVTVWGEVVKRGEIVVEITDSVEEWIRPFTEAGVSDDKEGRIG